MSYRSRGSKEVVTGAEDDSDQLSHWPNGVVAVRMGDGWSLRRGASLAASRKRKGIPRQSRIAVYGGGTGIVDKGG